MAAIIVRLVIAGLDPAIHPFEKFLRRAMDARLKPGHDDHAEAKG
jgi:hypothetical protein